MLAARRAKASKSSSVARARRSRSTMQSSPFLDERPMNASTSSAVLPIGRTMAYEPTEPGAVGEGASAATPQG